MNYKNLKLVETESRMVAARTGDIGKMLVKGYGDLMHSMMIL